MFIRMGIFAGIALLAATGSVRAQVIDDQTKCRTIREIMDADPQDKQKVTEVVRYVFQTMRAVDINYGARGKVEILPRMTNDGRSGVVATATVRCQGHQDAKMKDIAIEAYEGVRAMQDTLGVNN
jgi:hypothetical protein